MAGMDAFRTDPLLVAAAKGIAAPDGLSAIGRFVMSREAQELAYLANRHTPELHTHDRQGNRLDEVTFHPAWHALMRRSVANGLHSSIWESDSGDGKNRHLARALRFFLSAQLECGHLCPMTMTNASFAALMATPTLFREWAPLIMPRRYDPSQKPPAKKSGLMVGMGMTEKQGGTDIRAVTTKAEPDGNGFFALTGHKWFMSAPMSDAFLVLAQARQGLTCFLMPRILPDGRRNHLHFQRLKDKLGNRSNASSEVEFDGALAQSVGEPGEGIRTIMDMVTLTRLDCSVASAAIMRAGLAEAVHHARHRRAFGKLLIEQPLMQRVLADLALDVAAATALSLRLARAFDEAAHDNEAAAYARVMTPVVKYWTTKLTSSVLAEAMECLGGNGYVETGNLARHYREGPVNAIWEGPGNVMALDLVRVLARSRSGVNSVIGMIGADLGSGGAGSMDVLRAAADVAADDEGSARILTEQLALCAAAGALRTLGFDQIADAFSETRLGGQWRSTYGMLDGRHNAARIVAALYR
jgi:putative acyl-CoA dehydrogenase